jgi:hypothetical protein
MPEEQLHLIQNVLAPVRNVTLRFAESMTSMLKDLRQLPDQSDSAYLVTSRLDNDDALAADFIQTIQAHFTEKKNW